MKDDVSEMLPEGSPPSVASGTNYMSVATLCFICGITTSGSDPPDGWTTCTRTDTPPPYYRHACPDCSRDLTTIGAILKTPEVRTLAAKIESAQKMAAEADCMDCSLGLRIREVLDDAATPLQNDTEGLKLLGWFLWQQQPSDLEGYGKFDNTTDTDASKVYQQTSLARGIARNAARYVWGLAKSGEFPDPAPQGEITFGDVKALFAARSTSTPTRHQGVVMNEDELVKWRARMDEKCRGCGMDQGTCTNSPPRYRTNCCADCAHFPDAKINAPGDTKEK